MFVVPQCMIIFLSKKHGTLQVAATVNSASIHNDRKLVNLFWKKNLRNQDEMGLLNIQIIQV